MDRLSVNCKGRLVSFSHPLVMGILNVTPDSFFSGSRKQTEADITARIEEILTEGGEWIDVGGYSSRPNAQDVSPEEEMQRLSIALKILSSHYPDIPVSVDTFRASVARQSVEKYGASIINDISGGTLDPEMFSTIASLQVPYILMHMRGTPKTMSQLTDYDHLMDDILKDLAAKVYNLRQLGVNDIIIDPGFGFSKNQNQNYEMMVSLDEFHIFELPLLVGISRKRMIWQLLETSAEESLTGTIVLNTAALMKGAHILRVHDVRAAVEAVKIVEKLKQVSLNKT